MFDLAANLEDPVNLSIGQPDFPVPRPVKDAYIKAIEEDKNGYALTQGMPVLRDKLQAEVDAQYGHDDREVFVCSGTSGGLNLSVLSMMEAAITDKTKMIILNTPSNPTGICFTPEEVQGVAELAAKHGICLVSDEIYSKFVYDEPYVSAAQHNPQAIVIDGFSKTYAMTGHRVGYVHGPKEIIQTMLKVQQFSFVCAPHPAQWAGAAALDIDVTPYVDQYRAKRDRLLSGLADKYEIVKPGGAFYAFPKLPDGITGEAFVEKAISNNLMVIPGSIFSDQDSHFRISYAVSDEKLEEGIDILNRIA